MAWSVGLTIRLVASAFCHVQLIVVLVVTVLLKNVGVFNVATNGLLCAYSFAKVGELEMGIFTHEAKKAVAVC